MNILYFTWWYISSSMNISSFQYFLSSLKQWQLCLHRSSMLVGVKRWPTSKLPTFATTCSMLFDHRSLWWGRRRVSVCASGANAATAAHTRQATEWDRRIAVTVVVIMIVETRKQLWTTGAIVSDGRAVEHLVERVHKHLVSLGDRIAMLRSQSSKTVQWHLCLFDYDVYMKRKKLIRKLYWLTCEDKYDSIESIHTSRALKQFHSHAQFVFCFFKLDLVQKFQSINNHNNVVDFHDMFASAIKTHSNMVMLVIERVMVPLAN